MATIFAPVARIKNGSGQLLSEEASEKKRARGRAYMARRRAEGAVPPRTRRPEYQAEWRAKNPDYHKDYRLRRQYGITIEDFREMFAAQGGLCAICKEAEAKVVDHCHATGRVRGLLCSPCNMAIGLLGEEHLTSAASYLEKS